MLEHLKVYAAQMDRDAAAAHRQWLFGQHRDFSVSARAKQIFDRVHAERMEAHRLLMVAGG